MSLPIPDPPRLTHAPEVLLRRRLEALGLEGIEALHTHTNRTVMLSLREGVLRIHRGYAMASDRVLRAIVRFLRPKLPRRLRRALEQEFLSFPVDLHAGRPPSRRSERPRPRDIRILHLLARTHQRLNVECFNDQLREIQFRLSSRMKTRLGELSVNLRTGEVREIAISRAHVRNHSWAEVEHTVLHEMVHQWQVENKLPLDHGAAFRQKAGEVGIEPRAARDLGGREASRGSG